MDQNVYDHPAFFGRYSQFRRSREGLAGAPEWPVLRGMLPASLEGLRVADLGCGFGAFCRWAAEHGAASILGLDLSENMLARAREETLAPEVSYRQADLGKLDLAAGSADLVFSSLALHYIANYPRICGAVRHALAGGGRFVFSVEHPVFTAPSSANWIETEGVRVWPLDGYSSEGPRRTNWLKTEVTKHHRTVGTYVNGLLAEGFRIAGLIEWSPSDEQIRERPDLASETHRPPFLMIAGDVG